MMIRLSGGWVSVRHIQTITPVEVGGKIEGSTIQLVDGKIEVDEDPDVVAARVNEIRSAEMLLAIHEFEDLEGAVALVASITRPAVEPTEKKAS